MERYLLPPLNENPGQTKEDYQNFLRVVRRFTTFHWVDYEFKYPDLDLPLAVFTVGLNFIARGSRERHYNKAKSVQIGDKQNLTLDLSHISETKEFNIGKLLEGGNIEHILGYEQEKNILQQRYTLFVTDQTEWERIKGHPTKEILNDDFIILSYVVGAEVVEILVFDLLKKTKQVALNSNGSISFTVSEEQPLNFT